eukprot:TRINITY_DN52146_c0_g1_i1.p1 TRINITY_DN52146_c0_g1~~TRINITY_DN52146_c0_g1_i1.p1  ORF type:complete len:278 (+),score=77.75 TRINITY_DN52146_c0_g1_i1:87-920(+)
MSGYTNQPETATEANIGMQSRRFAGKVFLVTGASSGIGEVIASKLAADGGHVVLAARRAEKLEAVKAAIVSQGGSATVVVMDVMDYESVEAGISSVIKDHGKLDGAFNNAGGAPGGSGTIADLSVEDFKKTFDLNFYGTYHCMKAQLQVMTKQGSGSIVNNLSILGTQVMPTQGAYTASKQAVKALQEVSALESAASGVRVNSVSPGFCRPSEALDAFLEANPGAEKMMSCPQGHIIAADAVYKSVAFLMDDDASGSITGIDLPVAGGHSIPVIKLG